MINETEERKTINKKQEINLEELLSSLPSEEIRNKAIDSLASKSQNIPPSLGIARVKELLTRMQYWRGIPKLDVLDPVKFPEIARAYAPALVNLMRTSWGLDEGIQRDVDNLANVALFSGMPDVAKEMCMVGINAKVGGGEPLYDVREVEFQESLYQRYKHFGISFCSDAAKKCESYDRMWSAIHFYLASRERDNAKRCARRKADEIIEKAVKDNLHNRNSYLSNLVYLSNLTGDSLTSAFIDFARKTKFYARVSEKLQGDEKRQLLEEGAEYFKERSQGEEEFACRELLGDRGRMKALAESLLERAVQERDREIHFKEHRNADAIKYADLLEDARKRIDLRLWGRESKGGCANWELLGDIAKQAGWDEEANEYYGKARENMYAKLEKAKWFWASDFKSAIELAEKTDTLELKQLAIQKLKYVLFKVDLHNSRHDVRECLDIAGELGIKQEVIKHYVQSITSCAQSGCYREAVFYARLVGDTKQEERYSQLAELTGQK